MAKILIVDDAEFLRVRITKLLKGDGHEVIEASNGRIAIDVYSAEKPDAVLMDIHAGNGRPAGITRDTAIRGRTGYRYGGRG